MPVSEAGWPRVCLQAGALTRQHAACWPGRSEGRVLPQLPSTCRVQSEKRAGSSGHRKLCAADPVASGCPCGPFVCSELFIEHLRVPGPVGAAGAAEMEEATAWCQGPHSLVAVAACKQLVRIRCPGGVSKKSMGGCGSPEIGVLTCWSQCSHLSMGTLHYVDFRGVPVFYVLWFFMKAVLSWGLKHTWHQPKIYVESARKPVGEGGAYCALSIYLFTITPLMRLFCMARKCFSHSLLWLIAVSRCQEVAYGSWGREGSRACVRCAAVGLSQGWV